MDAPRLVPSLDFRLTMPHTPYQGKGNVGLMPTQDRMTARENPIQCRERLGGLLRYYDREAA
jgi:hypothetical protein